MAVSLVRIMVLVFQAPLTLKEIVRITRHSRPTVKKKAPPDAPDAPVTVQRLATAVETCAAGSVSIKQKP